MKRLTSMLLALAFVLSAGTTVFAQGDIGGAGAQFPIIEQIYGTGGKGETPISNNFVELYNPGSEAIELSGYSLVYGDLRNL